VDTGALLSKLNRLLPGLILEKSRFGRAGDLAVWVETSSIPKVAQAVAAEPSLELDWLEHLSVMQVESALVLGYFLRSGRNASRLVVRASVIPEAPSARVQVPSVAEWWPTAIPMQEELGELFGIDFEGVGQPGRVRTQRLLPEIAGFPLRKEFEFPTAVAGISHLRPAGRSPRSEALMEF
jgi:NADH:ubiquinone oxidoreductase subunit C